MLELLIGGSGSGKSAYAENEAVRLRELQGEGGLYYLATMERKGSEAERRIKKHRDLRKNKGFITVEKDHRIEELTFPKDSTVLLEALSSLLANEMFEGEKVNDPAITSDRIFDAVLKLSGSVRNLIIVSDDIFRDGIGYEAETDKYMKALAFLHRRIAEKADKVFEVCAGIPVVWK